MTTNEQNLLSPDNSPVGGEPPDETTETPANRTMLDLAVLCCSGLKYGIDMKWVREIRLCEGVAPVYGMPSFWVGVAALRGELFAVLDLEGFLFPLLERSETPQHVVFTSVNEFQIGLMTTVMPGVQQIDVEYLTIGAPAEMPYTLGITPDEITVLDLPALFADPRLTVPKRSVSIAEK